MKLTKTDKENIVSKIIKYRFQKEAKDFINLYRDFSEKVYNKYYEKDLAEMLKIPDGWLPKIHYINLVVQADNNKTYEQLSFNGIPPRAKSYYYESAHLFHNEKTIEKIALARNSCNSSLLVNFDDDLAKESRSLREDYYIFEKKVSDARSEINKIMNSANTRNQLLNVWPEVEPFLPEIKNKNSIVVIDVSSLNKTLELPVE